MMGLRWSWAFGNEDLTDLSAMGWTVPAAQYATLTTDADKVYSYSGSPTRYGWILDGAYGTFTLPLSVLSGLTDGWVAGPWKSTVGSGYYTLLQTLFRVNGTSGEGIYASVTSAGAISLYVSNTFQETSAVIDWTAWRYVALRWDMSGIASPGNWTGQVFVDGVAVTALAEESDAAETAASLIMGPGPGVFNSPTSLCSQVVVWSSTSDPGETAVFATRVEPTADGINIGTWTPSTGSDDYAVVASPFDAATFTQDAAPSASDRVEVVTSTIATGLGITPGSIAGVTAHTYSEGQALTARAKISVSGGTEAAGSDTAISASATSYAFATDTAAYTSTDTIDVIYEVVSV